jgi:hypothetical protein
MPATEDVVKMVGGMAVAVEAMIEALWLPCLARNWSKGHAKTSKAISSPSALETRARTETCSIPLRRRWPPTLEPSLVTMGLKSGLAETNCTEGASLLPIHFG